MNEQVAHGMPHHREANPKMRRKLTTGASKALTEKMKKDVKARGIRNVSIRLAKSRVRVTITKHLSEDQYGDLLDIVTQNTIGVNDTSHDGIGDLVIVSFNPTSEWDDWCAKMKREEEEQRQKERESKRRRDELFAQGQGPLSRKEWKEQQGAVKVMALDSGWQVTCADVHGDRLFEFYVADDGEDFNLVHTSTMPRFTLDKQYKGKCIMVCLCTRTEGGSEQKAVSGEIMWF